MAATMAVALGSFAGTALQASYAWMGFNRDQFALDLTWRQSQKYQEKNYQISWVAIVRDDIHQMMDVAVHHAASYVGISSMALSATVLAFATASFSKESPWFVTWAFYACGCTAFIFLLLSIMLGIKAQHSAHENTMKILTGHVRPSNPTGGKHCYMSQAEQIEKLGIPSLFRIPGTSTAYATGNHKNAKKKYIKGPFGHLEPEPLSPKMTRQESPDMQRQVSADTTTKDEGIAYAVRKKREEDEAYAYGKNPKEVFAYEAQDETKAAQYLESFHAMMGLWMPYVEYSKLTMGMGLFCDMQAFGYFLLGKVTTYADNGPMFLGCALVFCFVVIVSIIADQYEQDGLKMASIAMIIPMSAGPFCAVIGATAHGTGEAILVTMSFSFHFLVWAYVAGIFLSGQEHTIPHHNEDSQKQKAPSTVGKMHHDASSLATEMQNCANADPESGCSFWDKGTLQDFNLRASKKRKRTLRAMKAATFTASVLWFAMLSWAVWHYWLMPSMAAKPEASQEHRDAKLSELIVKWPSPAFQPRHLACSSNAVFVSDGLRVFEVFPKVEGSLLQEAREVQCGQSSRRIMDLSVMCTSPGQNCQAMALMKGDPNVVAANVMTCSNNATSPDASSLSSVPETANLFEVVGGSSTSAKKMIVATREDLVEYSWLADAARWVPGWLFWNVRFEDHEHGTIRALGSLANVLMLFRNKDDIESGRSLGAVEIRPMHDMKVQTTWHLPPLPLNGLSGACVVDDSATLLLVHGQILKATF